MYMLASVPIWTGTALGLAIQFIRQGPRRFYRLHDRSHVQFPDPVKGLEHRFIEANGLRFHAVIAGADPKKPLMLMLHGFPEMWYSWRHQLQHFQDDFECVAVDLRGYGETDKPKGRRHYMMTELCADVPALVRALGRESCTLVGHDWGANIAWHCAYAYPEVIDRMVILCVPHPRGWRDNFDRDQAKRSSYILLFQLPGLAERLVLADDCAVLQQVWETGPGGLKTPGAFTDDDLERYKQSVSRPGAITAMLNYYRAGVDSFTRYPMTGKIANRNVIQIPTLFLYADSDHALGPQLLRGVEKYVADLDLHILQDCSHWAQQDRPDEVNKLMADFFAPRPLGKQYAGNGTVSARA
jgi:pimeloyl-ACP methyl ester carboxylesterase